MKFDSTIRHAAPRKHREHVIAEPAEPEPGPSMDGVAAQFSHLIYADQYIVTERLEKLGATHVVNLNTNPKDWQNVVAFGFVLERRAWIVFRGSDDANDWAANLLFVPMYHIGFRIAWNVVKENALSFARDVAGEVDGFVLTGHSLGGALATLATRDVSDRGFPIEGLVTFGAPRVGSPIFAWKFNRKPANQNGRQLYDIARRYSTGGEWVSRTPFFFLGFQHVGQDTRFEHCNGRIAELSNRPLIRAIRETSLDAVVPFALPLFLPFLVVFSLDRLAYHSKAVYVRHFRHAEPMIDFTAPNPVWPPPKRKSSHPVALAYVLAWAVAMLAVLIYAVRISFELMAMPVENVLMLIGTVVFTQAVARWQATGTLPTQLR